MYNLSNSPTATSTSYQFSCERLELTLGLPHFFGEISYQWGVVTTHLDLVFGSKYCRPLPCNIAIDSALISVFECEICYCYSKLWHF